MPGTRVELHIKIICALYRGFMKLRTRFSIVILMATLATLSCSNAPVQRAVSHKDDYQQAYVYGFPMIAAYKALYQFNVDKTNSQYKGTFNQVLSDARYLRPRTRRS